MRKIVARYRFTWITLGGLFILEIVNPHLGERAVVTIGYSLREMLLVIPPTFLLIGLIDVWVPKETIIRLMGKGSGLRGIILALLLGSLAAGPLYAAFPVVAVLVKKGTSFRNVVVLLGAWSTTKIPMFLFEITSLGSRFAYIRLVLSILGIILISMVLERVIDNREKEDILQSLASF